MAARQHHLRHDAAGNLPQVLPALLQLRAELARQAGKPYLVHMDGRVRALLPLVAQSGFDALESFSLPDIGGDVPLSDAQAALPQNGRLAQHSGELGDAAAGRGAVAGPPPAGGIAERRTADAANQRRRAGQLLADFRGLGNDGHDRNTIVTVAEA